jgi:fermentation-respiration switch protein FrsA (DUF1100 family)
MDNATTQPPLADASNPQPKPRRSWKRRLLREARNLAIAYLGVLLVMLALENWLLFPATTAAQHWQPKPDDRIRDISLISADGTPLHAWWLPATGSPGAMLYCHGNGANLSHRGPALLRWQQELGLGVLIFDYPGYGRSGGSPTEAGCYAAADAAYDWLAQVQHIPPEQILLFGNSLGGGVATDLASRRPHRALVLTRTFTSAPDVAQTIYPWLPAKWLMRNRFDSLAKIGSCRRPVFVAHGDTDGLIPFSLGERLFAAANEPRCFLRMDGVDHNTPLGPAFFAELRRFLAAAEAVPSAN